MDRWAQVRRGLGLGLVLLLGEPACATTNSGTSAARRMYTAAEARVAEGAHAEATQLLRHALLQLPQDESGDEMRHALILRLAYVEMLAWWQTGDRVHLEDARRLLDRYLEKHEALFGDASRSRAQRGEVYEILHEVERRLEEADSGTLAQAVKPGPAEVESALAGVPATLEDEAQPEEAEVADSPSAAKVDGSRSSRTKSADSGDGDVRVVRVRSRQRPSIDDPETIAKLNSPFSDSEAGPVLTAAGPASLHGPRALVRLGGLTRSLDGETADDRRRARALGRTLVRLAREDLRACYADAFARNPQTSWAMSRIEVSIHPDGQVDGVRIADGGLDGLGDACVIERLQAARVEEPDLLATQRLEIPLSFIFQNAVYIHESTGRSAPVGYPVDVANVSTAPAYGEQANLPNPWAQ